MTDITTATQQSILSMKPSGTSKVTVYCRPTEEVKDLLLEPGLSLSEVKILIQEATGISPEHQNLDLDGPITEANIVELTQTGITVTSNLSGGVEQAIGPCTLYICHACHPSHDLMCVCCYWGRLAAIVKASGKLQVMVPNTLEACISCACTTGKVPGGKKFGLNLCGCGFAFNCGE